MPFWSDTFLVYRLYTRSLFKLYIDYESYVFLVFIFWLNVCGYQWMINELEYRGLGMCFLVYVLIQVYLVDIRQLILVIYLEWIDLLDGLD